MTTGSSNLSSAAIDGSSHHSSPPPRIVSLIPSATDICVHLGLQDCIVGVSHCCDRDGLLPTVLVVTEDQVQAATTSQAEIHAKVSENSKRAEETELSSCSLDEVPSLYPIDRELLKKANPTLIVTQDLCHVCAPSSKTVFKALKEAGIEATVVLLTPMTLQDVITNMQQVADAAGIPERGKERCAVLESNLDKLRNVIRHHTSRLETTHNTSLPTLSMLLMEWVDPPFCGGHWIIQMMELVGVQVAIFPNADGRSRQLTWSEIRAADPDVVIVACCGFDLERNLRDAAGSQQNYQTLRSNSEGRLYAANGDQFFARPSPKLLTGAVIMALCTYDKQTFPDMVDAITRLDFASKAIGQFQHIKF